MKPSTDRMPVGTRATFEGSAPVLRTGRLDAVRVSQGAFAVRLAVTETVGPLTGSLTVPTFADRDLPIQGFVDAGGLDEILAGRPHEFLPFGLLSVADVETLRTVALAHLTGASGIGYRRDAFDAVTRDGMGRENVVELDLRTGLMTDVDGDPLPMAMLFDHAKGKVDAQRYDLPMAIGHLAGRKDVRFHPVSTDRYLHVEPKTVEADVLSKRLPSCLCFTWSPNRDEYRAVLSEARRFVGPGTGIVSAMHQAVFETDALGLRKSGACKVSDYFASTEVGEYDDDSDALSFGR